MKSKILPALTILDKALNYIFSFWYFLAIILFIFALKASFWEKSYADGLSFGIASGIVLWYTTLTFIFKIVIMFLLKMAFKRIFPDHSHKN